MAFELPNIRYRRTPSGRLAKRLGVRQSSTAFRRTKSDRRFQSHPQISMGLINILFVAITLTTVIRAAESPAPCRIEVIEKNSGWPVPLVELRTTHSMRFVTDNAGVIAFD